MGVAFAVCEPLRPRSDDHPALGLPWAELHLSVATIKSHVSAMLATLQLDNRVQLALLVQDARRG